MLYRVVLREPEKRAHLSGVLRLRSAPRSQVTCVLADHEAPDAGLEIDYARLQPIGGRDHLLRVRRFHRPVAQGQDRQEEDSEDDRQANRDDDRRQRNPRKQAGTAP